MSEWAEPPHDLEAEQYVLASMMLSTRAAAEVAEILAPGHFWRPAHQVIYHAMIAMHAQRQAIDPVSLRGELEAHGEMRVLGGKGALYLAELYGLRPNPGAAAAHAGQVFVAAQRRAMAEEAERLREAALDTAQDTDKVLAAASSRIARIAEIRAGRDNMPVSLADLVDGDPGPGARVLIPGLTNAQDRTVIVGGEGRGKTTLLHQVAFAAAAGVHPFRPSVCYAPLRVFIADLENPRAEVIGRARAMAATAARYEGWDPDRVTWWLEPAGIDLASARDAFRLAEMIRRAEPDMVFAGPVYKMISDDGDHAERLHGRVTRFFDFLRSELACAVWLEHHAPFGAGVRREMRPLGSSVWMRWPETGLTLKTAPASRGGDDALDVGRFRGDRIASRPWPVLLTRNRVPGGWPWLAAYGKGVFDTPLEPELEAGR